MSNMALLETPSRIWRRIEDNEGQDMPSLPSLPAFEDSAYPDHTVTSEDDRNNNSQSLSDPNLSLSLPYTSTPAAISVHTATTIRPPSSTTSTTRFAHSIDSRSHGRSGSGAGFSTVSNTGSFRLGRSDTRSPQTRVNSFTRNSFNDISIIPSLPQIDPEPGSDEDMDLSDSHGGMLKSANAGSAGDVDEGDYSLAEALGSVSRTGSPFPPEEMEVDHGSQSKSRKYDYSIKSETSRATPFDKLRNVTLRNTVIGRRTPSLTHTIPSPSSSSSNSTPQSSRSFGPPRPREASPRSPFAIPLPPSNNNSPAYEYSRSRSFPRHEEEQEQDITEEANDQTSSQQPTDDEQRHPYDSSDMDLDVDVDLPSLPHPEDSPPERSEVNDEPATDERTVSSQSHSRTVREPTFSSEEATPMPHYRSPALVLPPSTLHSPTPSQYSNALSPPAPSTAHSSPAGSVMFTPTPAFQPRPRARFQITAPMATPAPAVPSTSAFFGVPATPANYGSQGTGGYDEELDFTTPFAKKKSFLIDVINSTARPRYAAHPTPHPRHVSETPEPVSSASGSSGPVRDNSLSPAANITVTASGSGSGSGDALTDESASTGGRLQAPFVGVTPRPRARGGRFSHPLAQGWTASSESNADRDDARSAEGSQSPYEYATDRASFISTASSHDLTTQPHARANASFDPVMGLGAGGHGVGRFNAGKLNSYLHGLNRRLQEENEGMGRIVGALKVENGHLVAEVEELKRMVENGAGAESGMDLRSTGRRRRSSGAGRPRISDIGLGLDNVAEDIGGEGWMEEKVAMEEELENLRSELDRCVREKEDVNQKYHAENAERMKDKERWRERMGEVEKGVERIVQDLESKLADAEARAAGADKMKENVKELERALEECEAERELSVRRAEQAARMMGSGGLGNELRDANEKLSQTMAELRDVKSQIRSLDDELTEADNRISNLEQKGGDERSKSRGLEEQLKAKEEQLTAAERQITEKESVIQDAEAELEAAQGYILNLEADATTAAERIHAQDEELAELHDKLSASRAEDEDAQEAMAELEEEAERNKELARQMEEALEATEAKMSQDEAALTDLRSKLAALERKREHSGSRIDPSRDMDAAFEEAAAQVEALEEELDEAHKEIGRLNGLLAQSPARKAIDRARDAKVEVLERERDELLERVKGLKSNLSMATPSRILSNMSGISPFHRHALNMTLKRKWEPQSSRRHRENEAS